MALLQLIYGLPLILVVAFAAFGRNSLLPNLLLLCPTVAAIGVLMLRSSTR